MLTECGVVNALVQWNFTVAVFSIQEAVVSNCGL